MEMKGKNTLTYTLKKQGYKTIEINWLKKAVGGCNDDIAIANKIATSQRCSLMPPFMSNRTPRITHYKLHYEEAVT